MSSEKRQMFTVPKIGMRSIKTAIAVTLCALLYAFFDRNATFACMSAVFAMNTSLQGSWKTGGHRLWGSVIGGFVGMLFYHVLNKTLALFPNSRLFSETFLIFIGTMLMILTCQFFGVNDSIPPASVVFFIVMLLTPADEYISYPLNRMLDTAIGVMMSILVNLALPRDLFERSLSKCALSEKIQRLKRRRECIDSSIETHVARLEALNQDKK